MHKNNISGKDHWAQPTWPGSDFIIFDCDRPLSPVAGIDELDLIPKQPPLTQAHSKAKVVTKLLAGRPGRSLRVGFGGAAALADVFISCPSLAPVLPLALPLIEPPQLLDTPHQAVLDKGLTFMSQGDVIFNRK